MNGFSSESTIAILGLTFPVAAAMWEFVLVGRKRLGYRVQMDTIATDVAHSSYAGVLQQMQQGDTPLLDPSFVLLRIERYPANEVGKDILRSHGHRPCSELAKPLLCRPV